MSSSPYDKDPNSVLDYKVDWSAWLQSGETISSHEVVKVGSITVDSSTNDDTSVTVWISGGSVGEYTTVTTRITTNEGRTEDKTFRLNIKER